MAGICLIERVGSYSLDLQQENCQGYGLPLAGRILR